MSNLLDHTKTLNKDEYVHIFELLEKQLDNNLITIALKQYNFTTLYANQKYILNLSNYPYLCRWAYPDLNRRPPPCEGDVITTRP